ncbi:serine hydrolase domain-containing protein [Taibaiella koreensis]|uniref:serine hydrolase domain-containing protein n=1 Tax=Taibaiella koreensis TaxID=1268548 RepID=UPI000E59D9CD|nr:serine hydrolase [Taibaiella koreensis]
MQRILFYLLACCLLLATPEAQAQKRKSKSTTHSKQAKAAAKKKKGKSAGRKKGRAVAVAAPLPPLKSTGDFNTVYSLHGGSGASAFVTNPAALQGLDAFINNCISRGAFPGCQIMAVKDGEVVYQKNFGYFTYDRSQPVTDTTLYDIASVTKVAATTLAIMKLYEEGKINLSTYLKNYLPFTNGTDKAYLTIKDLLLHQAGLKAFIPFYKTTVDKLTGSPRSDLYSRVAEKQFTIPVAANFYLLNSYRDTIWNEILNSNLDNRGRYVYSDLDFYFLEKVAEAVSGQPIDQYVYEQFYRPLGLKYTMYNPWKKGLKRQCAPTENDQYFRFQLVQGYVHDPGTAMLGGIAGHAGIFSNTRELAVILQMLINGGEYKGRRYLKKETLQTFTGFRSSISRRAYGFDKPEKARGDGGPASDLCSKTTFGHQGFTGTCAWADPENGITFIFLSNRVYPSADNGLINSLKVRFKAQSYIYEALGYDK